MTSVRDYEAVIGLEVHAQLRTRTKIFCGCDTAFGAPPNRHTCPVCLGMPGALPVLNRAAVEMAIRMGLAVGSRVHRRSVFARKNYFYPDLPKGYQISQYDLPLCEGGAVPIEVEVDWRVPTEPKKHLSVASDIGPGGAFLFTDAKVDPGTPLVLEVRPPGARQSQTIEARVAWTRSTPGQQGLGLEFRCRDLGGQRRLRELVRRFETR